MPTVNTGGCWTSGEGCVTTPGPQARAAQEHTPRTQAACRVRRQRRLRPGPPGARRPRRRAAGLAPGRRGAAHAGWRSCDPSHGGDTPADPHQRIGGGATSCHAGSRELGSLRRAAPRPSLVQTAVRSRHTHTGREPCPSCRSRWWHKEAGAVSLGRRGTAPAGPRGGWRATCSAWWPTPARSRSLLLLPLR